MIYDCFPFFNELDLLDLRLNTLDQYVDYFVISESQLTFSGKEKPLYYSENKHLFEKFQHKIIHNIVPAGDLTLNSFERDVYQKDSLKHVLSSCSDDDIIIFSDLDEIPNPERLPEIFANFNSDNVYHLAQRNFYFYVNYEETSGSLLSYTGEFDSIKDKKWLGTKICSYKIVKGIPISHLRWPQMKAIGIRIENGGWHFTYMGGEKSEDIVSKIQHKIKSSSHQELNNKNVLKNIGKRMSSKKDIFGRKTTFKVVELDNSFPKYLLNNLDFFSHLILKENDRNGVFSWPRFW